MLKLKLSKLKQICASVLLPRLLLKSLKYPNVELNYNRTIEQLSKARKSTNCGNKDEANDKQMKIIEKCFSENISETETKVYKKTNEIQNENIITPEFYKMAKSNKYDTLISRLFNNKTDDVAKRDLMLDAKTQATTSKIEEEKLTQKIEIIDETPHVEAHAPKVEGFNATPKVLGHESCTFEMSKINNPAQDNGQEINLDELSKRCMGLSDDEIDKILIQVLKNASRNNSQPKSDLDYIENTNITNLPNFQSCYKLNAHNECRFEKIQPTHLDSVPLLALDTSSKVTNDYKMSGLIREYPTILSTVDIDDPLLDVPALSPYEKQAIPFYEYINKENIAPEDESKIETAAITETVEESEIIINDETLHRDAIDQGDPRDGQTLHPKPNINQFTEISEGQHITISEEIDHLHNSHTQDNVFNVLNSQRLYTSNPDQPTDWHSHQDSHHTQQKDEPSNSSISSAFLPGGSRRTLELPLNTAISANQNPEEYYTMSFPDEFVPENQPAPVQRIFADCPVTQNVIFSALPQVELEEVSKGTERIPNSSFNRKDLLSHVVLEPEVKEDVITSKPTEAKLEELVDNKDRISCHENTIPLSLLLKKIREQNRLEYCRNIFAKADIKIEGTKKFACPPPLDKSKPKTSVKPCQPKPKPACEPCKPTPCPAKKDPCAKFLPITFSSIFRYDIATNADLTSKEPSTTETMLQTSVTLITEDIVKQIDKLGEKLKFISNNDVNNLENATIYARDFEPWIPIPSWPISKKEKDRPFVCPKEGCKVPVVRTDKSTKEKQCDGVSKKSFALSQVFSF